ncbi:hypothetical protein [Sphingomonas sp.]|uniref:hypothetical protein n=1 Tax=Sphingomonas sp. TaxID=28214 RepID=UPI002C31FF0C|nr:hypothetical protein [Sphingomonas sp.]HTG38097.1 hypothetical protein [Sphingomonas sp.]
MRLAPPMLIAAGLLAGCAATPEQQAAQAERDAGHAAELAQQLDGFTAGDAQACLPVNTTRRTRYYGDTILYEVSGRLVYRTDTTGGCNLERDDILVTQTPIGRLCRGDIARTIDRTSRFQTGSCALGAFVPYRKTTEG